MIGLEIIAQAEADELVPYASFYLGVITEELADDLYVLNVRLFRPEGESWRAYDGLNPLLVQAAAPYFRYVDTWPRRQGCQHELS